MSIALVVNFFMRPPVPQVTRDFRNMIHQLPRYIAHHFISVQATLPQLMVNWWFGFRLDPLMKGIDCYLKVPLQSQTTNPNHSLSSKIKTARMELGKESKKTGVRMNPAEKTLTFKSNHPTMTGWVPKIHQFEPNIFQVKVGLRTSNFYLINLMIFTWMSNL